MKLRRWDPWREFETLQDRMNRMFDAALLRRLPTGEEDFGEWAPAVDVAENADHYLVKAELPGVKKDDIKVDIHDGTLTIQGEKKAEEKEERDNYLRVERSFGSFVRSFTLPESVDAQKIKASYKDGVLELNIPKKEEAKPKRIEIKVD